MEVIQINIYHGKFLDKLIAFLRMEKPDIITMQEVSAGRVNFWTDQTIEIFKYMRDALGLEGIAAPIYRLIGDSSSYESNAVLTRGKILTSSTVQLKEYREYTEVPWEKEGPEIPRNVLDLEVEISSIKFHILCTHSAWTKEPVDTPEKIRQARLLADHLRSLGDTPFILGGDFNMEPGSEVINIIDEVARNTVYGSVIKNTLNLRTHRAAATIGPGGRLVDFIYTSPHFRVASIDAPEVDVSDHLPVRAVLSLED